MTGTGWWQGLAGPFSGRGWRATVHLVTGGPVALVGLAVLGVAAAPAVAVVALPFAVGAVLAASGALARAQRGRIREVLGEVIIPSPGERPKAGRPVREALADRYVWRRITFHLLAGVLHPSAAVVVVGLWSAAFALPVFALLGASGWLPEHSVLGDVLGGPVVWVAAGTGVVLLWVTPWIARGLAVLDVALARALLGQDRAARLHRRVETLTRSRTAVVAATDAERRRIERDLHDGTQQRLVALAMNLGMMRASHPDLPEIAEAHEEAKQALAELRDVVRGLHPAVLDDRGLAAALSGIAARSPVPVTLDVAIARRPSAVVESVAYFIVSESLTNTAKHSGATRADVAVGRAGDLLRITVRDDGTGGADPSRGSGLRGLADRARSVDGALAVHSPVGGPTTITAELPCG